MHANRTIAGVMAARPFPVSRRPLLSTAAAPTRALASSAGPVLKPRAQGWAANLLRRVLYGSMAETATPHELARARFDRQQMGFHLQEAFFADQYERPASAKYSRSWGRDQVIVRFDRQPRQTVSSWLQPDRNDPARQKLCGGTKSWLNQRGQIVPDGPLAPEIWEEHAPVLLANLAYAHVMSINKPGFAVSVPPGVSSRALEDLRARQTENLAGCTGRGSPLTSFTARSLMGTKLESWGQAGLCIQLSGEPVSLLTPHQIAWMIMEFANAPGIDEYRAFDWRRDAGCFDSPDCEAVRAMEQRLAEIGIDPDGQWTRREKAVFYVLMADEHMSIGVTPPGSAALVETRKRS